MKQIALLHYAFPPIIGGVEVLIEQHAKLLSEFGYDIKVLTGSTGSQGEGYKVAEASELQSLLTLNPELYDSILVEGFRGEEYDFLEEKILQILEVELADRTTVIVHNMLTLYHNMPFISAFRAFVKRHPEKQYIAWVHDHTYIGFEKLRTDEIHLPEFVDQLLRSRIEGVTYVAISESLRSLLLQVMDLSEEEIRVIPNGINIKAFLEISDPIWEIVQSERLLHAFPLVLSPVNILGRKNLEYSLEVLAVLKKTYPSLRYLITGKPSEHRKNEGYDDFLKKRVSELGLSEQVLFIHDVLSRYLSTEEIHDWYSLADVVFHFSKGENFGLPLVEAFLTKTPLTVSNLRVFQEVSKGEALIFDFQKVAPQDVALAVDEHIKSTKTIKAFNISKREYSLQHILKDKVLPLLSE